MALLLTIAVFTYTNYAYAGLSVAPIYIIFNPSEGTYTVREVVSFSGGNATGIEILANGTRVLALYPVAMMIFRAPIGESFLQVSPALSSSKGIWVSRLLSPSLIEVRGFASARDSLGLRRNVSMYVALSWDYVRRGKVMLLSISYSVCVGTRSRDVASILFSPLGLQLLNLRQFTVYVCRYGKNAMSLENAVETRFLSTPSYVIYDDVHRVAIVIPNQGIRVIAKPMGNYLYLLLASSESVPPWVIPGVLQDSRTLWMIVVSGVDPKHAEELACNPWIALQELSGTSRPPREGLSNVAYLGMGIAIGIAASLTILLVLRRRINGALSNSEHGDS